MNISLFVLFLRCFHAMGGYYTFVAVAIGGAALIGGGVALYEGAQNRDALSQEQQLLQSQTYQPIDVAALQKSATAASIQNATDSLNLQRSLQPNVAKSNDELQASVANQLALGGKLDPDTINQINQQARSVTGSSGATGSAAPLTSALIGQNALSLLQSRQAAAEQLSAANPAPAVGLSPSDLASATIANQNGINQFNLAKAGAQSNLINSTAQNNSATASGVGSSLSQALSLLALSKGGTTGTTGTIGAQTFDTSNPTIVAPGGTLNSAPISTSGSLIGGFGS